MRIQVTISSYGGAPVTLLGLINEANGVLAISPKAVKYSEQRLAPDMAVVSNLDIECTDWRFTDDKIQEAIVRFFTRKSQGLISIPKEMARLDPESKIELDTIDAGGRKYRLAPDIGNGHVAILAMVAYADKFGGITKALSAADEMLDFYKAFSI